MLLFPFFLLAIVAVKLCESNLVSVGPRIDVCTEENCKPPDCRCSSFDIPGALNRSDTPQIVTLTFHGGLTITNRNLYNEIFNGLRKNPNGQNISATFFINHEYTDYTLTHQYWRAGHEIGLNTITKNSSASYWPSLDEEGWVKEFVDQRTQVAHFAKIPATEIQGVRSPYFSGVTDAMYNATRKNGLRYDSSRRTPRPEDLFWPHTGDYQSLQGCVSCLKESHPGFWISPLESFTGSNGEPCSTVETCLEAPKTVDDTYNLLYNNFLNHSQTNRAPVGIHISAAWLLNEETPWITQGYLKFIDKVLTLGDSYILSISKALDWVQNPKPLSQVDEIDSWKPSPTKPNSCTFAFSCTFGASQLPPGMSGTSRYMQSCQICPSKYPWLGNPLGRS